MGRKHYLCGHWAFPLCVQCSSLAVEEISIIGFWIPWARPDDCLRTLFLAFFTSEHLYEPGNTFLKGTVPFGTGESSPLLPKISAHFGILSDTKHHKVRSDQFPFFVLIGC
ncbi:hypothetical protein MLD38_026983 [Melastoma candidum]|uniref:Uncharacterized protein n=1 Tax=Melastoma candidum TaxID=119954 RepID=A0ACB9P178_9MYRT|nr:hypothetical protein MLD38_026983 [Melastoma candidum]